MPCAQRRHQRADHQPDQGAARQNGDESADHPRGVHVQPPDEEVLRLPRAPRPDRADAHAEESAEHVVQRTSGDQSADRPDQRQGHRPDERPGQIPRGNEDDDEDQARGDRLDQAPGAAYGLKNIEGGPVELAQAAPGGHRTGNRGRRRTYLAGTLLVGSGGCGIAHRTSVISGPRRGIWIVGRCLADACGWVGWPGTRNASSSRGGRGSLPRSTATPAKIDSITSAAWSSTVALPVSTPRRNHRGPSTPRNLAGRVPVRPSGIRTGRRASSSGPNVPVRSSALPPCFRIDSAISLRSSSQSPSLRGAANACTCNEEPSNARLTATTRRVFLSNSMRTCRPWRLGTCTAPRSIRSTSSGASAISQGPVNSAPFASVAPSPSVAASRPASVFQ